LASFDHPLLLVDLASDMDFGLYVFDYTGKQPKPDF
jgi:hypothetical protein